jgi:hypothetical protein
VAGVAGREEPEHVAHAGVVRLVQDSGDLEPTLHLGIGVRDEVGEQIATRRYVRPLPRVAVAVGQACAGSGDDGALHVPASDHGGDGRVVLHGICGDALRCLFEQLGDHGRDHLDVAEFLGADRVQEVAVLAGDVGVERLEAVLHRYGDLAVLPAEDLLHLARVDRIGFGGCGVVLKLLPVEIHGSPIGGGVTGMPGCVPLDSRPCARDMD